MYKNQDMLSTAFNKDRLFLWKFKRGMVYSAWAQGLGRHTADEMTQFMTKDLQAVSDFLGRPISHL